MDNQSTEAIIYEKKRLPRALKKWGTIFISLVVIFGSIGYGGYRFWQHQQSIIVPPLPLVAVSDDFIHQQPVGYLIYETSPNFLPKSIIDMSGVDEGQKTDDDFVFSSDTVATHTVTPSSLKWARQVISGMDTLLGNYTNNINELHWSATPTKIKVTNAQTNDVVEYQVEGLQIPLHDKLLIKATYDQKYLFVATEAWTKLAVYELDNEAKKATLVYETDSTVGTVVSMMTAPDLHRVAVATRHESGMYLSYYDAYNDTILKQEHLSIKPVSSFILSDWVNIDPLSDSSSPEILYVE